jgi:hypothetical protein
LSWPDRATTSDYYAIHLDRSHYFILHGHLMIPVADARGAGGRFSDREQGLSGTIAFVTTRIETIVFDADGI